jgi:hypothetical protein
MDIKELGCEVVDLVCLAEDWEERWGLASTVMLGI